MKSNACFCPKCGKQQHRKQKRKRVWIILVTVILLAAGGMATCFAVLRFQEKRENQKIVSDFLEAYIALEEETSSEYLYQTDSDILSEELAFSELQKSLAQKLSYEITGASLEEGYGIVNIRIKNTDFQALMEEIMRGTDEISEEEFENLVMEKIPNADSPAKEYECTANVYRTSDGRKIEMTVSLSNALLGGVPEYIASVAKGK